MESVKCYTLCLAIGALHLHLVFKIWVMGLLKYMKPQLCFAVHITLIAFEIALRALHVD